MSGGGPGGSARQLFEPSTLNGMALRNRIIRSATWTGLADESGRCSPQLVRTYERLARGGVGLIVTGHAYVSKDGQAGPWQLGIDTDQAIPGLRALTDAVHGQGGRIVMQLSHAGMYADARSSGREACAVSARTRYGNPWLRELTPNGIEELADAFVLGAQRAHEAGFDGVQLHAAHGYLLNQFLSPAYNLRRDAYGGELVDRARLLLGIVRRIRGRLGRRFPLVVKLSSQDFLEGGLSEAEALEVAVMLERGGVDAIEVSGGTRESGALKSTRTGIVPGRGEAYFGPAARRFKARLQIPVAVVGGIRTRETAAGLLATGAADYVAMSRPFIHDPELVERWRSGDGATVGCVSENACLELGLRGGGIRCSRAPCAHAPAA